MGFHCLKRLNSVKDLIKTFEDKILIPYEKVLKIFYNEFPLKMIA